MEANNKYVQRLFDEWKQHGKIIIAVDFDDTVSPWKFTEPSRYTHLFNLLNDCRRVGAHIVCFTACKPDRFDHIATYFKEQGLTLDGINQVPVDLPYGNQNKIYANIFLDDRAGLNEAVEILEMAMVMMRSHKVSIKLDNPGSTEF